MRYLITTKVYHVFYLKNCISLGKNYEDAISFLKMVFMQKCNSLKQVYTHVTCATDTDQVEKILNNVFNMIISANLNSVSL